MFFSSVASGERFFSPLQFDLPLFYLGYLSFQQISDRLVDLGRLEAVSESDVPLGWPVTKGLLGFT